MPECVITKARWPIGKEDAWRGMLYYEQIEQRPPWLLRLLLPTPVRVHGPKSSVGDESTCHYETGHLKKRVTAIQPGDSFHFEVFEQSLTVGGTRLLGGCYELSAIGPEETEISLTTRYQSKHFPRFLARWLEAAVCHAFHRHILSAMRKSVAASAPPSPSSQGPVEVERA